MGDTEHILVALDDAEGKLKETAHHESGHIVIAATLGLRLRCEGLMIDTIGEGLGCYCKHPGEDDSLRERIMVAAFAGCASQSRFCEIQSRPPLDYFTVIWSPDWKEARGISTRLTDKHLAGRSIPAFQEEMEQLSKQLVADKWPVIEALANALLKKDWEPIKPLKSGNQWSKQTLAKYITGDEAVRIIGHYGIAATCVSEC